MARLSVVRSGIVLALMLNMTGAFAPTHLSSRFMLLDPPRLTRRCNGRGLRMSVFDEPALMLAATAAATSKAFEAQPPPLGTTLAVLGSTGGVLAYWWLVLVPSERRDLAKNKNKVSACLCVHAVVIPCVALFLSTAPYCAEHTGRS